MELDLSCNF